MAQTSQIAPRRSRPARPPVSSPVPPPSRREQGRQRRSVFLRRFRACGEVKLAAERAGIAHATLYRWRARDDDFRARWDSVADQRRFEVEDRLMRLVREGERSAVFHKGEQVGWRVSHTARPALALLAYLDRREKLRIEEEKRALESHFSGADRGGNARSAGSDDDDDTYEDDEVGDVEEEDDEEAEEREAEEEEAEEEEAEKEDAAAVAPESVSPKSVPDDPPAAPPPKDGPIWVRIIDVPFFDNTQLHLPGALVEISSRALFSSTCMEELTPEAARYAASLLPSQRRHPPPDRSLPPLT